MIKKSAVIYARFSSDKQNETSIEAQERACREYAKAHNLIVTNVYVDEAVSGKTTNRASYQRMMRDLKKGLYDVVLIHKYDRIARNLGDHINLQNKLSEQGVKLIAVAQDFGDGKEAKLMRGIQWILSEYYIDNLSEEVRKGMKEIALKGRHNGGVAPFGYDIVDKEYKINLVEADYVRKMFDCAFHKKGYSDLLKEMNDKGITGKRGKPFRYSGIYEILRNEKYTGTYIYSLKEEKNRSDRRKKPNAIRVEGAIPAIVSKEKWKAVQEIMDKRKQTKGTYKCSGLVYCQCGAKMFGHPSRKNGHEYLYYSCSDRCGNNVKIEIVDNAVDLFLQELKDKKLRKQITDFMVEYAKNQEKILADFETTRKEKLSEKQQELDNILANMRTGLLSDTVLKVLNEKVDSINKKIEDIKEIKPFTDYNIEVISDWLDFLVNASDDELPKLLIERIDVTNDSVTITSTLSELIKEVRNRSFKLVAGEGLEPPTFGL